MSASETMDTAVHIDLLAIASLTGVTLRQMRSQMRDAEIVDARHLAYWWLRRRHCLTYPVIGRMMHRDHTTILAAYTVFEARCERRPRLATWRRIIDTESTRQGLYRDWLLLDPAKAPAGGLRMPA